MTSANRARLLHFAQMSEAAQHRQLSALDLRRILGVTRALAAPFDLTTMLAEVVNAAAQVLDAERGSVWLHDAATHELVLKVATGLDSVRLPAGKGIVGTCARTLQIINVPDCYADPRFDPALDQASGYRTRCMLTLPLVDHKGGLVGVLQVLNRKGRSFDGDDEALAMALAAQCAVALQRVRMTEAMLEGERMRNELEMARAVQLSTLPAIMPIVPGYDVHGLFQPADLTGGDTFDLAASADSLLVVLADATGHGIAPALSVTQMQAMLRMSLRMGASLETAFTEVNNQLAETLADDRFITAFIGQLDLATHRLRFHSAGQAPILHFQATTGTCARYKPTSFPLGAMPIVSLRPAVTLEMQPGDILVLLSDGVFEYHDPDREQFGENRVEAIVQTHHGKSMNELAALVLDEVNSFARGAPQEDDITMVLVKRAAQETTLSRAFARDFGALNAIFSFTADAFTRLRVDAALLPTIDLVVEELFTNMVKYSPESRAEVYIGLARIENGVEVTLTDHDVEPFDVTQSPEVNIDLPIEERTPGGLGLQLIRRLTDSVEYAYSREDRQSRITIRKTQPGPQSPGNAAKAGGRDAGN